MARAVHRSGLVALGIATALMASCAFAAKDVVVAVGSNFTTLDPYDANDVISGRSEIVLPGAVRSR